MNKHPMANFYKEIDLQINDIMLIRYYVISQLFKYQTGVSNQNFNNCVFTNKFFVDWWIHLHLQIKITSGILFFKKCQQISFIEFILVKILFESSVRFVSNNKLIDAKITLFITKHRSLVLLKRNDSFPIV